MPSPQSARHRYLIAAFLPVVATVVKEALGPVIVPSVYLTYYAAVLASAQYAGFRPALLTTALSAVLGAALYLPPIVSSVGFDVVEAARVPLFIAIALVLSWLVSRHQRAEEGVRQAKAELEERVAERTAALRAANERLQSELGERERVQEALRFSEERYRQISEMTSDYGYRCAIDERGRAILEWHAGAFTRITGYLPEEVRGLRGVRGLMHPDDLPIMMECLQRLLRGESVTTEFRLRTRSGEYRWVRDHSRPEWNESKTRVVRIVGAVRDINESKVAEKALRESEERYALAVAGSNDGVWDWDLGANVVYLSPRWKEMLGFEEGEIGNDPQEWVSRIHPDDVARVDAEVNSHLNGASPAFRSEYRLRRKDGSYIWVLSRALAVRDAKGVPYRMAGSLTDVTRRRQAEEEARRRQSELAHAQRLSTIGEMAAGMAHELNQPLAAIVSFARGCERRIESGDVRSNEFRHVIDQIAQQGLRAGDIVKRYRAFVRNGERRDGVDVNALAREVAQIANASADEDSVSVHLDLDPRLPTLRGDAVQIEQVLVNLFRNGVEAMHDRPRRELRVKTQMAADEILVSVEDGGHGIPEEIRDRIFETFFTTKGEGLGMGLSISRSIIDAHGGRLWATPAAEGGTVFHFTLPIESE